MKKLRNKFSSTYGAVGCLVVICAVLAVIGLGAFFTLRIVWQRLLELVYTVSAMDTVIIIALISGMVTIFGLIVNSAISLRMKNAEFKYKRKTVLLKKLEAPYTQFVNLLFDMVHKKDDAGKIDEEVRNLLIRNMSREIILYGSDNVVKKWAAYKKQSPTFTLKEHLFYIEGLLHMIREDMGIEQGDLSRGDLLALFVDDAEELTSGGSNFQLSFGKHKYYWDIDNETRDAPDKGDKDDS